MTKKQGFPQVFLFINGFCRRPSLPEFGGWFNLLDGYLDHRTGGFLWAFRKRWDMVGLPYQMRKEWRLQDACCCFLFHHDSFSLVGHSLIHCILICPDMPLPNVSQDDSQQRDRFWWNLALWNFVDIKITARDQTTLYRGTRAFSRPWQIDYVLRRGETEKDAILCRKSLPIVWLELFLDLNYQIWFVRFWFAETKTSGEKNNNNSNKILETPKRLPANSITYLCFPIRWKSWPFSPVGVFQKKNASDLVFGMLCPGNGHGLRTMGRPSLWQYFAGRNGALRWYFCW